MSTSQSCCKIDFKNTSGESIRNHGDFRVADPKLVPNNDIVVCGLPHPFPAHEIHIETITTPREQIMSNVPKTPASSHTFVQEAMGDWDLPEEVNNIICLFWRDSTTSRYEAALRKWKNKNVLK